MATGSNIQLKCKSNNSSVMFAWYFNSSPVKTNMRVSITAGELSSTLRLNNVAQDDSGWYTCRGANANGYNYRDFLVAVGSELCVVCARARVCVCVCVCVHVCVMICTPSFCTS